jgi:hypothetical protein
MLRLILLHEFIHLCNCAWNKMQEWSSSHSINIPIVQLKICDLILSLPGCSLCESSAELYPLWRFLELMVPDQEGGRLTLWGCPSWTLWGRQQDWLCRMSTRWGWRATSFPSRYAWPRSSQKTRHLQEAGRLDWPGLLTHSQPKEMLPLWPGT